MKKLLYFLGALVLVVVLALVVLVQLVDTNRVKRVMIEQVRERTGRTLVIEGDISWRFFPSVGFTLGKAALLNPEGFAEGATLSIGEASLDVALMPLLDNRIDIGEAVLKKARLHLLTRADGKGNLDDLSELGRQPEQAGSAGDKQPEDASRRDPLVISLAGVRVEDAEVILQDERNDSLTRINQVNLQLDRFAPGEFVPVSLSGDLFRDEIQAKIDSQGRLRLSPEFDRLQLEGLELNMDARGRALPGNKQLQLTGSLDYLLDKKTASVSDMQLTLGALTVQGELSVSHTPVPVVRFELATELLDLDTLMAEWSLVDDAQGEEAEAPAVPVSHNGQPAPANLSFLKNLDLSGTLQADKVLVQGMELEQLRLLLKVAQGKLQIEEAEAGLYQGKIQTSGELDVNQRPVAFRVHKQLEQVDARQFLQAALDVDHLAGSADLTLDLQGRGLDADSVKQSLKGSSQLRIRDGALYGVNIPALLRRGYAQVKGLPLPDEDAVKKTDFSALTADFIVGKGLISTDNLRMASPLLRLHGAGEARLQDSSLDFLLDTAIVGTLKGQDGKTLDELKGITIPLRITGTYQEPKYGLDMQLVFERYLQDKVDKEAERLSEKLGEKLDDKLGDKLKEKLPGLLDKLKL
ncbi:AsmA family protein [Zobellella maritima]|uniref:AsmA family protein n=1 Tax=Zobellella maritima TaxID=2059725 RepID=UPI000E301720|nr:AsmA family protein [Zobellella maritima]